MTLKNEAGYVWRIFEFEYHYDSPVDLYDVIRTYNANNELLYRASTYYNATNVKGEYTGRIIKNFARSFNDQGEKICEINYSGGDWLQFDGGQSDGVYDDSNKFCVFAYDSEGQKKGAREYQMDGIIVGHWEYIRENGILTEVKRRSEYDGYSLYTIPEFDSEGRLVSRWTYEYYDESGIRIKP